MKSLLVTLVFTATATVASAQLINPDFETGDFTGWTVSGWGPYGGPGAYVFSEADEGITGISGYWGFYAGLSNGSIVQTSGIYLRAGETVSVWMNASETNGGGDLTLMPENGQGIFVPWLPFYQPGSAYPDRWNKISFKIQQDGIYKIGASGGGVDSFLGVDHFTITPVPESSTYGLMASLLGVAAIFWRRRNASTRAAF